MTDNLSELVAQLKDLSVNDRGFLRETVQDKRMMDAAEANSSASRRAEATRLLTELDFDFSRAILKPLLMDESGSVRLSAALALARWENEREKRASLATLLDFRERGHWLEQNLCEEAILSRGVRPLTEIIELCECDPSPHGCSESNRLSMSQVKMLQQIVKRLKRQENKEEHS